MEKCNEMLDLSEGKLSYTVSGEGPLLVLVCTLSGSWAAQVKQLARKYTVVTYDMRGFGYSESDAGYPSNEQHADDLKCLVNHLNLGKPILVGLSHGGIVLQHFARRYCHSALGYMFVATLAKPKGQTRLLLELLQRFLARGEGQNFWEVLRTFLVSEKRFDQFMAREKILRRLMFNQFTTQCLENIYNGALKHDATPWLDEVARPSTVISGKHDILFPAETISCLVESLPNCQWHVMDCAHLPPVELPEEFNHLVIQFGDQLIQTA